MSRAISQLQWMNDMPPIVGEVFVKAISGSADSVDITTIGPQPGAASKGGIEQDGGADKFIYIYADGADVGYYFGPSQAAVTGGNAPALATNGLNAAGCCARILSGQRHRVRPTAKNNWMGFVGSGAGQIRITVSSH